MKNVLDQLTQTSIQLLLKEPYYGHFFTSLLRQVTEYVPTLAVSAVGNSVVLSVNPQFWSQGLSNPDHRLGVVKHEILHLVFGHVFRGRNFANTRIFNIAADLVVNQYVASNQLPAGAVLISSFSSIKMERDQTVDYYYNKLIELTETANFCVSPETSSDGNAIDSRISDNSLDSSSGEEPKENRDTNDKSIQNLESFLELQHPAQDRHDSWDQIYNASGADRALMEAQVDQAIIQSIEKTAIKDRGLLPAFLNHRLNDFQQSLKPKVNWRRVVRIFAESSSRTYLKNTLKRPSKRYGTTPGTKVRRRQKFMVAVDTSGSVNQDELQTFFSEIYHLWRWGAEIQVVECDAEIGQIWQYSGQLPSMVTGGGGTNFTPPIEYANKDYHPDAIFYFTDGHAPAPSQLSRSPILWVISQPGIYLEESAFLPGRKIKLS